MHQTKQNNRFLLSASLFAAFVLWTALVCLVDVQPVGPNGSSVGFAGLNQAFHTLTGVSWWLYTLTDWLSLIPAACVLCLGLLGLTQWCRRKNLWKVDADLLLLGGHYVLLAGVYVFFEVFAVNYRPVLVAGVPEVSYPSSTTLLILGVMPTVMLQLRRRVRAKKLRNAAVGLAGLFTAFMAVGRLISGVHWLTDIVGGVLLASALLTLYSAACKVFADRERKIRDGGGCGADL